MDKPGDGGKPKEGLIYTLQSEKPLLTDFDEIMQFDRDFWEITKGLPVRTGSLTRLSEGNFARWGIGITEGNRELIRKEGDRFRKKDYEEIGRDSTIESMEAEIWSTMTERSMMRVMAHFSVEVLTALDDGERTFNICELASDYGQMSINVASSLFADPKKAGILARTNFMLVDYLQNRLDIASSKLGQYRPASVAVAQQNDDEFLDATTAKYDIILSLCHLHKKPFLGDTLGKVQGVLAKKGVLISGDWHSSLSAHPLIICELLQSMGVDSWRLNLFRKMFGAFIGEGTKPAMTAAEKRSVEEHQKYWVNVNKEILASPKMLAMKSRHYVIGAYDTTEGRLRTMEDSGLITDPDRIRKAFRGAKLHENPVTMAPVADRASVIMALKGRRVG